ncbi:TetR/AcrR family transcriptional regulator [Streptomyces sp. enrichment culture]|uniref:TetR/AcrR family transcriptional regulator n=1 Tax=Streptomyces sp. enrichment culture TaxID=1795815 RepID=UPI003F542ABA
MSGIQQVTGTGGGRRRPARERILAAAARRFYSDGITATGIDTITADAGVAKMSLYNNFSSKAELVRAYLERRHAAWRERYAARLSPGQDPRDRVLTVFDTYIDSTRSADDGDFRGCALLNAAAEMPVGHETRALVGRQKQEVEQIMADHLAELLPDRPDTARTAAAHLSFLLEGAITRAGLESDSRCLRQARTMAADLLDRL